MPNITLSLVFCCYNVSLYLDKVFSWIKEQPYQNIEVVFVEDCSTDDTKEKLRKFVATDSRCILVENAMNLGASQSRNVGLSKVSGVYVGFPDSDDEFALDWLVQVGRVIHECSPAVIICGMREEYEKDGKVEYSKDILSKYSGLIKKEKFVDALLDLEKTLLFGYMNNKFYLRSLLQEYNFKVNKKALLEDWDFNLQVFSKIDSFFILNHISYFYKKRINGASLTARFVPDYFDIHVSSLLNFKDLLEQHGELSLLSKGLLVNKFFRYLLSAIERNAQSQSGLTYADQKVWIKEVLIDKKYQWFLSNTGFATKKGKLIAYLSQKKSIFLLCKLGRYIGYVKRFFPVIFAKLKN